MFEPEVAITWSGALVWLGAIGAGAFLAPWLLTDVLHLRRAIYVGVLALLTGGLTAGYLTWSGSGAAFWLEGWPWGLAGAVVSGAFLAVMISRIPARRDAPMGAGVAMWEGLVYGSAEGLLLSVLPVLVTWQLFDVVGWTDGWRAVVSAIAALGASVVVIVVHHLGYREFRGPAIRSPVIGCGVLSLAYLVTASPVAAIGGHIILHLAMLRRGMELPPQTGVWVSEGRDREPSRRSVTVGTSRG